MDEDWALPTIRLDRCTGCGLCVAYCPTQAVEMGEHYPTIVRPHDCAYCGMCEDLCPANAIVLMYEIVKIEAGDQD
jgi:2-oxoglutarate ferredoxin oxidoreductase subunit delta